ncbi:MAG: hypothetical protein B2I17_03000 [Thermoplasmatales archaeon B_DKE]|nr:MAG: hypothetical protein B2I17_03000 [Thermoplasmatales archaeon B_DKE]QRF75690.1 hypothetical protein Thermo_01196 [Thermoplasmatales archaeon]
MIGRQGDTEKENLIQEMEFMGPADGITIYNFSASAGNYGALPEAFRGRVLHNSFVTDQINVANIAVEGVEW